MNEQLAIEVRRLREVREELDLTQAAFAERLGVKHSTVDLERGKVKLSGKIVMELARQYHINPMWLYGQSDQKRNQLESKNPAPKMISVDGIGQENILMVNAKAAAGYADNLQEEHFIADLPVFSIPLTEYRNASFRGFQVKGDSMMPAIKEGDWVIASAVEALKDAKQGKVSVFVEKDCLRIKKLKKNGKEWWLESLNEDYETVQIDPQDIQELWMFHSVLSSDVDFVTERQLLEEIRADVKQLKAKL